MLNARKVLTLAKNEYRAPEARLDPHLIFHASLEIFVMRQWMSVRKRMVVPVVASCVARNVV